MKALMIQRAEQFSPNSVERDRAILDAVADRLRHEGYEVETISEACISSESQISRSAHLTPSSSIAPSPEADLILSMARLPETLAWLKTRNARVVNRPEGVERCARHQVEATMRRIGSPMAPAEGPDGYWLKRGDAAAQSPGDVVFCQDKAALDEAIAAMRLRGISNYCVSAHVRGDLVKFYGVTGGFFRWYYPTDDGQSKFGDERRNGEARHYAFDRLSLQREAERLAQAIGIDIYGGDCIVRADGTFCLIDFNDWPSFSRCRDEAADAIAMLVKSEK